jgi:hypothetical protein
MPDMTVPPPNQCFADGSAGAEEPPEATFGPPLPPSVQPNADVSGTDGAEGAGNAGSDDLVRRVANDGAGGAPGIAGAVKHEAKSCLPEDLKALGSCGNAIFNSKGGTANIPQVLNCAGAVLSSVSCHLGNDSVSER